MRIILHDKALPMDFNLSQMHRETNRDTLKSIAKTQAGVTERRAGEKTAKKPMGLFPLKVRKLGSRTEKAALSFGSKLGNFLEAQATALKVRQEEKKAKKYAILTPPRKS